MWWYFLNIPGDQSSSGVLGVVRWGKTRGRKSNEKAVIVIQARNNGGPRKSRDQDSSQGRSHRTARNQGAGGRQKIIGWL